MGYYYERKPHFLKDFFTFKMMVFPVIVQLLYILSIISYVVAVLMLFVVKETPSGDLIINAGGLVFFVLSIIPAVFILHVFFEFCVVLFSILDTLREIRNELMHQSNNQAIQIDSAQRTSATAYSGQTSPYVANNNQAFQPAPAPGMNAVPLGQTSPYVANNNQAFQPAPAPGMNAASPSEQLSLSNIYSQLFDENGKFSVENVKKILNQNMSIGTLIALAVPALIIVLVFIVYVIYKAQS